jgi:hypothetical protein
VKENKIFRGKVKCSKCGEMGHRQSSYKCSFNGTKKKQVIIALFVSYLLYFYTFECLIILLMPCRKIKPRKNKTKNWFPDENRIQDVMGEGTSSQALVGEGTSSLPVMSPIKKSCHKKIDSKEEESLSSLFLV